MAEIARSEPLQAKHRAEGKSHERRDHESKAGHLERQENNAEKLGIEVKDELESPDKTLSY